MEVVTFGEGRTALRFGQQKINLHPADNIPGLVADKPTAGLGRSVLYHRDADRRGRGASRAAAACRSSPGPARAPARSARSPRSISATRTRTWSRFRTTGASCRHCTWMKIAKIEAFQVALGAGGPARKTAPWSAFIATTASSGIGEASPMLGGARLARHRRARHCAGAGRQGPARPCGAARHGAAPPGQARARGALTGALAALDIALWDIKGKVFGQPVYKLLGGAWRPSCRSMPRSAAMASAASTRCCASSRRG